MSNWKKFEKLVKDSLEGVHHRRIKTRMSGYKGDNEIADFYAYKDGSLFYFEVKHTDGNTFPFSMIQPSQLVGLWKANLYKGVHGDIILSLGMEEFYIVPITSINRFMVIGRQSMNREDLEGWAIPIPLENGKLALESYMKSLSKYDKKERGESQ